MRLINVQTLKLHAFNDSQIPRYAILSHTWGDEEVSFQEMTNPCEETQLKGGYKKIASACAQAYDDEHDWIWIDTCCIDKSSSAELSEAINSMYRYYQRSAVCYAYLSDVKGLKSTTFMLSDGSKWWTRGWTLQELIAPATVQFYAQDWVPFGERNNKSALIQIITGIPRDVLQGESPARYSVAQRMSWASSRHTSRLEDQAYCLLGMYLR
jgi:hypothetical protein